ncbi:hypothetical protein JTE90_002966 [Oedothorax gibbosus]|uniref:Protein kinase domain-containing protein n=1 Tax=Oedothorax gibbosus TaxID=931172 RepID=A0AAV6VHV6_9ARAC|nr:hypothetical protein JTE90_002966 [Oedothorax gibbosus]
MNEKTPRRTPFAPLQCRALSVTRARPLKFAACQPFSAEDIQLISTGNNFGLTPPPLDPFLHNQSLPCFHKDSENGNVCPDMGEIRKYCIDKFRGDNLGSISYSPSKLAAHQESDSSHHSRHLNGSSLFHKDPGNSSLQVPPSAQNPNKAIVTINAQTTEILTANKLAFHLLGIQDKNSPSILNDFILSPDDQYLFSEADLKSNGELVLFSGKVMDLITSSKDIVPVSVWARQLSNEGDYRCLVVMEPVERITGTVKFDSTGKIIQCDSSFSTLYGYYNAEEVFGVNIKELIPSVEFGSDFNCEDDKHKEGTKQCLTARTIDGFVFPLSIQIKRCALTDDSLNKDLKQGDSIETKAIYEGTVWVFSNISGLITLLPDGTIHSCNTNFSLLLFGFTQQELVGKNVSALIPSFYDDVEFLDTDSIALPPFDDDEDSNAKCGASDGRTTADSSGIDIPRPTNPTARSTEPKDDTDSHNSSNSHFLDSAEIGNLDYSPTDPPMDFDTAKNDLSASFESSSKHLSCSESQDTLHSCTNSITESDVNANFCNATKDVENKEDCDSDIFDSESSTGNEEEEENDKSSEADPTPDSDKALTPLPSIESFTSSRTPKKHSFNSDSGLDARLSMAKASTPKDRHHLVPPSDHSSQSLPEGEFVGVGRHRDGKDIAIEYYIKKVILDDGKCLYCLWVSRDPDEIKECSPVSKVRNSDNFTEKVLQKTIAKIASERSYSALSESSTDSEVSETGYIEGSFSDNYTIVKHIGQGAFGCIKKAYRNTDGLLVIAKFIRKSEVYVEAWVHDNKFKKEVPLEVSLLSTFDHPNIVKVLDVYENHRCFQMVMEKHGCGMDLFEFIERNPYMDEPLTSYIFRQIVAALSYLHGLSILHRDIKDENVIIDEKFHVKLIDFGSAAFMGVELFSSFCGTMEYCSPEVIRGNKYRGPELEMFALGVTLYTLEFGENPFVGAEEILAGDYDLPNDISVALSDLIAHLLEPDPKERCTLPEVEKHPWVTQPVNPEKYKFSSVIDCTDDELHPPKYFTLPDLDPELESSQDTNSDISSLETKMENVNLLTKSRSLTEPCSSTESDSIA